MQLTFDIFMFFDLNATTGQLCCRNSDNHYSPARTQQYCGLANALAVADMAAWKSAKLISVDSQHGSLNETLSLVIERCVLQEQTVKNSTTTTHWQPLQTSSRVSVCLSGFYRGFIVSCLIAVTHNSILP